jgi:hypothetical protein
MDGVLFTRYIIPVLDHFAKVVVHLLLLLGEFCERGLSEQVSLLPLVLRGRSLCLLAWEKENW